MSGHNKWSTIKRKKGANDQKRGQAFSKMIKAMTVAARESGADPANNVKLRTLIDKARTLNMPADTIQRAIKRGSGGDEGVIYKELTYEGYGPCGIAVLIEALTENSNRTTAEVRHALSKHNGALGESGCVQWMFNKKGVILVPAAGVDEEAIMEVAIENGADEVAGDEEFFKITCSPSDHEPLRKALEEAGYTIDTSQISMEPQTTVAVTEEKDANQVFRLMNALEDLDDVQDVYSNFDISDELMEKLAD